MIVTKYVSTFASSYEWATKQACAKKIACFACEIEVHKIYIQIIIKEVNVNLVVTSHIQELNGI